MNPAHRYADIDRPVLVLGCTPIIRRLCGASGPGWDLHRHTMFSNQMNGMNPKVDFYFSKAKKWRNELEKLRTIVLDCQLTEELKWGVPCYTFQGGNIVLIHVFKEYCALLFFKGALLHDTNGILIQQTENVQATRQIRFTGVQEISDMEPIIKAYIYEAIEV